MKLLEVNTTRLSLAVRLVDPASASRTPVGGADVALRGARGKALVHRNGYRLFLDVPRGLQTLSWKTERYEDGEQSVDLASLPALAPVVEVSLAAPAPVSITLAHMSRGYVSQPYEKWVTTQGGKPPFRFEAEGLPAGLSLDRTTGLISGTPTETGTRYVTVNVTDINGASAEKRFRPTIAT